MATDARAIEVAELTSIMSTEGGRNVIRRHLNSTGVFTSTWNDDSHKHAYNAGKRQAGLTLVAELQEACPDKYSLLLEENNG